MIKPKFSFRLYCTVHEELLSTMSESEDPSAVKVFSLAGFNAEPAVKAELEEKILRLGGEVQAGVWSQRITHVLTKDFNKYHENVMMGLVTGRWVVTRRFVDNSCLRGGWANTRVGWC